MRSNDDIVKLIKEYRLKKSMSQSEMAKQLHIDRANIARWENGTRPVPADRLNQIANILNIDYWYLIGAQAPSTENRVPIKKFGSVKAGPNGIAYQEFLGYEYFEDICNPEDYFVLTIDGDSMTGDGIYDGDEALIKVSPEVEYEGQIAVVIVNGDEGTLKHVHFKDGVMSLIASNPIYPPQFFSGHQLDEVRIVGVLKELKRKF